MTTQWNVVADVTEARVYQRKDGLDAQPQTGPELIEDLLHPEGHLRNQDLKTDRPGRSSSDASSQQQGFAQRPAAGDVERERFAEEVGRFLERSHQARRFDELALVAPPKFLGDLRRHLGKGAHQAVIAELPQGLMHERVEDVVEKVKAHRKPRPLR
jgi:protein required for attachment to host cells